jgi:hypothetical protein
MKERCTCPNCGHDFDPDKRRRKLEEYLREKMDHTCYKKASFKWMQKYEMYVHLPKGGLCTTTIEDRKLPDNWKIGTVWCKGDKTIVSLVLDD